MDVCPRDRSIYDKSFKFDGLNKQECVDIHSQERAFNLILLSACCEEDSIELTPKIILSLGPAPLLHLSIHGGSFTRLGLSGLWVIGSDVAAACLLELE